MSENKLPKIYAFNNGGKSGWMEGLAVSEDGTFLANHISSSEGFMIHDLGVEGSDWKHEVYNSYYPNGWEIEFVSYENYKQHEGLQKAIALLDERASRGESVWFDKASKASVTIEFDDGKEANV